MLVVVVAPHTLFVWKLWRLVRKRRICLDIFFFCVSEHAQKLRRRRALGVDWADLVRVQLGTGNKREEFPENSLWTGTCEHFVANNQQSPQIAQTVRLSCASPCIALCVSSWALKVNSADYSAAPIKFCFRFAFIMKPRSRIFFSLCLYFIEFSSTAPS